MTTPLLRGNIGSVFSVTAGNSVSSGNYSVSGDKLAIDNTTNLALFADFELVLGRLSVPHRRPVNCNWWPSITIWQAAMPGQRQAARRPCRASLRQLLAYSGQWKHLHELEDAPQLSPAGGQDGLLRPNNGTGQTLATSWVLKAQCWSPEPDPC